jgi:hypothetical protein
MADLGSQLLGVHTSRKSPSGLSSRRSNVSLRQAGSLAQDLGGAENDGGQRFTLAHELAAALMPDPVSSSRLLADEFGIEIDDDDEEQEAVQVEVTHPTEDGDIDSKEQHDLAEEIFSKPFADDQLLDDPSEQPTFGRRKSPPPAVVFGEDPLLVLNQSIRSTDAFLQQLGKLDTDSLSSTHNEPLLEQLAANIIRRIDETTREREEQIRELQICEREFRKIAEDVGGNDLLGDLDALEHVDGLIDENTTSQDMAVDDVSLNRHRRSRSYAWQEAPDPHSLDILTEEQEEQEEDTGYRSEEPITPQRDQFPPPSPPSTGPPTPSNTIPHLAYMRTITQSLVNTLGTISEQAQVNAAANAEAVRKIRAAKNRLGVLKSEWDSVERSRIRVENWEAGIWEDVDEQRLVGSDSPREDSAAGPVPPKPSGKRIDARKIVEEELKGFSLALKQAGDKTKAIMASS